MKIRNEAEWQGQLAEFSEDENPLAGLFRDFVIAWADAAEALMDNYDFPLSPIKALRGSLRATEEKFGHFEIGFVGMALLLLCTHWESAGDPDAFYESLGPIEQNLFSDVARVKLAAMQQEAAAAE